MRVYVELDHDGTDEVRGVDGTLADIKDQIGIWAKRWPVKRVLNEQGEAIDLDLIRDVTDEVNERRR